MSGKIFVFDGIKKLSTMVDFPLPVSFVNFFNTLLPRVKNRSEFICKDFSSNEILIV